MNRNWYSNVTFAAESDVYAVFSTKLKNITSKISGIYVTFTIILVIYETCLVLSYSTTVPPLPIAVDNNMCTDLDLQNPFSGFVKKFTCSAFIIYFSMFITISKPLFISQQLYSKTIKGCISG